MHDDDSLSTLFWVFVPFSLTALGGGFAVVTGMQQQAVDVHGWMSAREFLNLFAIARSAPGPGSMLATLIGWQVAGLAGAFVATVAMFVPSSILCAGVAFIWNHYRGRSWLSVLEEAVAPVGVGLMIAGLATLAHTAASTPSLGVILLIASGICLRFTSIHPILVIGLGALANAAYHYVLS
jgi:chromate transporter